VPIFGKTLEKPRSRTHDRAHGQVDVARVRLSGLSKPAVCSALSDYLGCGPDDVRLGSGHFGKPKLLEPRPEQPLEFSVSRCDDHCLIAVSLGGVVGVDLERRRLIGDIDRIASVYFTPAEARTIAGLQDDQKLDAFFACWTSKEAYTKALGTGLLTPLDMFAFPTSSWNASSNTRATIHGREWTLSRFEPWPGYTAAVVVAGRLSHLKFHIKDECVNHPR